MGFARARRWARTNGWLVPSLYVVAAIVLAVVLAEVDRRHPIEDVRTIETTAGEQLLGAIATGMIAFTGIVFSVSLLVVQSWNTTYSPRLIQWLRQAPLWGHAVGMFSATFVYALIALVIVGLEQDTRLVLTEGASVALVLASVGLFLALLFSTLRQMNLSYVLDLIGSSGRETIDAFYGDPDSAGEHEGADIPAEHESGRVVHRGAPRVVVFVDFARLVRLATRAEARIELDVGVGDTVADGAVIARVIGGEITPSHVRRAFVLGTERTMEQDPKFALRLLADVAIRALSPAVNDPSTAVQALDQIDDLLRRIGQRRIDLGRLSGERGFVRVVYPAPTWADLLALATDEIRVYGAGSLQVTRRLRLLLVGLEETVTETRRAVVRDRLARLDAAVDVGISEVDRDDARTPDPQGLGLSRTAIRGPADAPG